MASAHALPDLHSQSPAVRVPVRAVGHRGVKRPLLIVDSPAMAVIDVAVGLLPDQRGAHMSRLIDCLPQSGSAKSVRAYVTDCLRSLQDAVPDAASWSLRAEATRLITVVDGVKPIEEICWAFEQAGGATSLTWGVQLKVCLACPQAQAGVAFDRDDDNVGLHPSHNQVCDLKLMVTGDIDIASGLTALDLVDLAESSASGPVRERHKRRSETDFVTAIHHKAMFAEDALRNLSSVLRARCPEAAEITCEIVNYESIFEYPLHCVVSI
jgi:GTP cyclohydrolase FolE2